MTKKDTFTQINYINK